MSLGHKFLNEDYLAIKNRNQIKQISIEKWLSRKRMYGRIPLDPRKT